MQYEEKKQYFIDKVGELIKELRENQQNVSINQISREYDIDKSSWSRAERGFYSLEFVTVWRYAEALGVKFSDFAKLLEEKLGNDFKLTDE